MTIVEALKSYGNNLLLRNGTKWMVFSLGLWVIYERQNKKIVQILETESESEAVAKLLENDDASL